MPLPNMGPHVASLLPPGVGHGRVEASEAASIARPASVETKPSVMMVLESMFPTKGGGGAETQVRTLGRHLIAQGVPVSLLSPMVSYGSQVGDDNVDGIAVTRIAYPRLPGLGALIMLAKLAWLLFRLRNRYTIIHAHIAGNMAAVCCLMGWLLHKPVLVKLTGMTEMVGGILDPNPSPAVRLRKRALRLATYYQATSSQIGRLMQECGFDARKVHLIPNAVDTQRFETVQRDESKRRELCGDRRIVGIFVGRLESEKNLELMLDGWAQAFAKQQDAALVLVGAGRLMDPLKAQAERLGIGSQVIFVGASDAVERYMALADFGLLTSNAEGLSNTLLEYMASGLPVIGSRISGTEDFVASGKTGWLFTAGDTHQFKDCLHAAAQARANLAELGQNARRHVVAQASIGAVVNRLLSLYKLQLVG